MITPLQASAGTVSTTLMQSMIDQADEKRIEDEKKARKDTKRTTSSRRAFPPARAMRR